ncbi:MAG: class I SAM-dependent methyltransferase [Frankiales bacterium]|nr:class I SAM-dependent methyltransferase [Frankiales bacterium]
MLVTSRAHDEYVAMFDLGDRDLGRSIVDVAAGSSGFAARWSRRGGHVVSVDPAYAVGGTRIAELGRVDLERGSAIAAEFPDRFVWDWFGDPQRRQAMRSRALAEFLTDLVSRPGGYLAAALPALPFRDGAFDLAISSHLLFTWADQLGLDWHHAAVRELARVAREVRLFPTVLQGAGDPVPFWAELMARLDADGLRCHRQRVPYEFQKGVDEMLVVLPR